MTFWDHLDALRGALLRSLAVVLAASAALFFFKEFLFDGVVLAPAREDFFIYRLAGVSSGLALVNIEVAAQFMTHLKVTFFCALILCTPYLLFEIWRFVAPALYAREKRATRRAFLLASGLFYLGLAIGYLIVLPLMVHFFQGYSISDSIVNTISLTSYISTVTATVLLFGLVFEVPVLLALLSRLGLVTRAMLRRGWRYAVLVIVVLAALITPSGDPFSLLVVCLPLFLLYLIGIALCRDPEKEVSE